MNFNIFNNNGLQKPLYKSGKKKNNSTASTLKNIGNIVFGIGVFVSLIMFFGAFGEEEYEIIPVGIGVLVFFFIVKVMLSAKAENIQLLYDIKKKLDK